MDSFAAARRIATHWHGEACARSGGERTAAALLAAAAELTGIPCVPVADGDGCLAGAEANLDREVPAIFFKRSTPTQIARFQCAHEYGHHWLESVGSACEAGDFLLSAESPSPFGVGRVEGYGRRERREAQANVFAREFLLPASEARRRFLGGARLSGIAAELGVPRALVAKQLARGLLLPEDNRPDEPEAVAVERPLDPSQRAAAEHERGALLLEAGPGTGKTHTLIARLRFLLDGGVPPASILVLTFSNKAAEELRDRLGRVAPEAAAQIWAGTFHAFGLDLLRKYGDRIGIGAAPPILDDAAALALLEENLAELPLRHYLQLYDPVGALASVYKAISRAKDERAGPEDYLGAAAAMPQSDVQQIEAAERASEVAAVYGVYQRLLADSGALDFGDLIDCSTRLIEDDAEVAAALHGQYRHVMVDEFQDVNHASFELLRALCPDGQRLWVVGDARQSIYRFRGAAPRNLAAFHHHYPDATRLALTVNYRSRPAVVRLVEAHGRNMPAGRSPPAWTTARAEGEGTVALDIASDLAAEAAGLAAAIRAREAAGIRLSDQAILCRSHTQLARFAAALEAEGIPLLYLGDLFERSEIRDILCALAFHLEGDLAGLLRLGEFEDHPLAFDDVRAIIAHAVQTGVVAHAAAAAGGSASEAASPQRARIAADAAALRSAPSVTEFLETFLFERSGMLAPLVASSRPQDQQKRIAIFQLLQTAAAYDATRGLPHQFLAWVRRLKKLGDERQLRAPPAEAASMDAVRLMTVHASKGLEFSVVYLPGLGKGAFPASRQHEPCPLPAGIGSGSSDFEREIEEQCLFFVALSRARDELHLSRAENYGINRSASSLLLDLAPALPGSPDGAPGWRSGNNGPSSRRCGAQGCGRVHDVHIAEDLDQYLRCSRTYLYQRVVGLGGGRDDNGYVRFHRAVYGALGSVEAAGDPPGVDALLVALDGAWARIGPVGHPFEPVYYRQAQAALAVAARRWSETPVVGAEYRVRVAGGEILLRPDMLRDDGQSFVLRRLRTGRAPANPPDDDIYALYHSVIRSRTAPGRVEVLYLADDRVVTIAMTDRVVANRLGKYEAAIAAIAAGEFPDKPGERLCPSCPQYFACASPFGAVAPIPVPA